MQSLMRIGLQGWCCAACFSAAPRKSSGMFPEFGVSSPRPGRTLPEMRANLIVEHYRQLIDVSDASIALAAARRWCDHEARIMAIGEASNGGDGGGNATTADELLARARIQLHFLAHQCFLRPNQLLDDLWRIGEKPIILVQGRMDMVCPPISAFEVSRRLAGADLRLVVQRWTLGNAAGDRRGIVRGDRTHARSSGWHPMMKKFEPALPHQFRDYAGHRTFRICRVRRSDRGNAPLDPGRGRGGHPGHRRN